MSFDTEVIAPQEAQNKQAGPFLAYPEAFKEEAEYRHNIVFKDLCRYGIKPLDDAMRAIAPKELIVIAAAPGSGKTECALAISRYNALRGKRVVHYHLEGGRQDAVARMLWRDITDLYFREYKDEGIELDYRRWVLNENPHPLFLKMASMVYGELKEKLQDKLFFYESKHGLTYDKFCESLNHFAEGVVYDPEDDKMKPHKLNIDLIVVDHIHYFRFPDEQEEIRAMTKIMMTCQEIVEQHNIPIVVVAHLRKLPRQHGIPDQMDIYGTSNIPKIANTCLILVPDHERDNPTEGLYPTFIRVAKSRQGLRQNVLINTTFDIKTRKYLDHYDLYRCGNNGDVSSEALPIQDCPAWYRQAYNERTL